MSLPNGSTSPLQAPLLRLPCALSAPEQVKKMPSAANRLIRTPQAPTEGAVTLAAAQTRFTEFNAAVAVAEALHKRGKLEQASVQAE